MPHDPHDPTSVAFADLQSSIEACEAAAIAARSVADSVGCDNVGVLVDLVAGVSCTVSEVVAALAALRRRIAPAPPRVTPAHVADQTVNAGATATVTIKGVAANGGKLMWLGTGPIGWSRMDRFPDGSRVVVVLSPPVGGPQRSTVTVRAVDEDGNESQVEFEVLVAASPPQVDTPGDVSMRPGAVVDVPVAASGGGPFSWSVSGPSWVEAQPSSPNRAVLHVAPPQGLASASVQVQVSATDAAGVSTSSSFQVSVL